MAKGNRDLAKQRDKVLAENRERRNRSYDAGYMDGSAVGYRAGYRAGYAESAQGRADRFARRNNRTARGG